MNTIKIGIVEDEAIIADTISATLSKLGYEALEPCISYGQAIEMLTHTEPDLILIDIQLAGKRSGIDLAAEIRKNYSIPFIFLTSNSDPATLDAAKGVNPDAYLVKPFNKADLYSSIEIALSNSKQKAKKTAVNRDNYPKTVFIKEERMLVKLFYDEVKYIMSDHVYLEVHTDLQRHIHRSSLIDFYAQLPPEFIQVHRRYVVNLNRVTSIASNHLMIGDIEIPVSKGHKEELMQRIHRI